MLYIFFNSLKVFTFNPIQTSVGTLNMEELDRGSPESGLKGAGEKQN
jgi:hypothetical protein